MKKLSLALAATLAATSAFAGNITYEAPVDVMVEMEPNVGSGAWLIPLVIIAVLALALTSESETQG